MKFSSLFIDRPVLALVLSIVIVLFGALSWSSLGVRDYPAVDPPVISVRTTYPGANASVIDAQITAPIEESVNGISGIRTLTSTSSDGQSSISVEFYLGTDLEAAANDVRDRVSRATHELPPDAETPTVTKADANAVSIIMIALQSARRTPLELTDFANNVVKERLQTIADVSEVGIWGEKRYAIRLWMDPSRMVACQVTALDVKNALLRENVELPAGTVEGLKTELTIRTIGGLRNVAEFNNLIIRQSGGQVVRFSDIGEATEGAENPRSIMRLDGIPMIGVVLIPQAGANYVSIANDCYKRLESIKKEMPADIQLKIGFDVTTGIRKAVVEVEETILLAFLLVVLVIFLFLRNWRATLIPVLAIPISLIGAFIIMQIAGFSINILTLLALVLATGLVVDDAIVVLENIYNKIEKGMPPIEAGHQGSREIFFAIISTTLSLAAVLMPVVFMQGMTGRLFREFGVVVAGSVLISAFVSLSLTPMLCTRFLKHHDTNKKTFHSLTEPFFEALIGGYRVYLERFLAHRWIALIIMAAATGIIVGVYFLVPTDLPPVEDRSRFSVSSTGQEGASYEYMRDYVDSLTALVLRTVPEQTSLLAQVPGRGAVNTGSLRLTLSDPSQRKRSQQQIVDQLGREVRKLTGARTVVSQEQTIGSRGGGLPVQYVIQAPNLDALREKLPLFLLEANKEATFLGVDVNMKFNKPELRLEINRAKAQDLGVSAQDIVQTLGLVMNGTRYDYFLRNGRQYQVIGQFNRGDRDKPLDLTSNYVRNSNGTFVQLDNVVTMTESSNPPQLYRFNRYVSATVSAGLAPGATLSQGVKAMQAIGTRVLDERFTSALAGPSRDLAESSSSFGFAFLLALILVYLVLAAQFESFRDPLIVMFTVPLALAGALLSLWYFSQTMNIFSQIGIIMLIGLVAKNGILIVEFANQRRSAGMALGEAIVDAAVSRFRPIVMTSLTVILGSLPIALALGAGAKSRMSMGIVVIGGLAFSLVLSLFVVPAIYTFIAPKKMPRHLSKTLTKAG
jgi:multidrug efflux pump